MGLGEGGDQKPLVTRAMARSTNGVIDEAKAALAVAYRDHGRIVFNLAARVCGRAHAEDVTQEVFLRFWRHPERFDPSRGTLRIFLLTMAHSCSVDLVRSSQSRRAREDRTSRLSPIASTSLGDQLEADEANERVCIALNALPSGERDAIVTAFFGECSYRQAAVVLGEPEGTIKARIRAGLRRLAPLLAEAGTGAPT